MSCFKKSRYGIVVQLIAARCRRGGPQFFQHDDSVWNFGGRAHVGTFADAAAFGELVFDCTNGANSLAALRQAGADNLRGKILAGSARSG
jgi:hypothetical protein